MNTITRDLRDPNSADKLTEDTLSNMPGVARTATQLLRLPRELRTVARQERTYRINTEPGWRPSDLMCNIVDRLLDGRAPSSPVARGMVQGIEAPSALTARIAAAIQ